MAVNDVKGAALKTAAPGSNLLGLGDERFTFLMNRERFSDIRRTD
jgi:hypothetical protein